MSRSDDCTCDSKSVCRPCEARYVASLTDQNKNYYPFDYTLDGPPTIEWW